MSQWTHFLGTIQCSARHEQVVAALGKPVLWTDDKDIEYGTPEWEDYQTNVWCAAFKNFREGHGIPMGSEGSINYTISDTNVDDYSVMGEGTLVALEGDLRDFGEDPEEVVKSIEWFVRACKELAVRTAILYIDVEWGQTILVECTWTDHKVTVLYDPHAKGETENELHD